MFVGVPVRVLVLVAVLDPKGACEDSGGAIDGATCGPDAGNPACVVVEISFGPDGGIVDPGRALGGGTGDCDPAGRFGSWIPVGGAFRVGPRRGGNGGKRRPHA